MAVILLGYFSTMVATLIDLMMLLNTVLPFGFTEQPRHQLYPHPVVAAVESPQTKQVAATDKQAEPSKPVTVAKARLAAVRQPAPGKNQQRKLAFRQSRREDVAGRQQDQRYSLALGYGQEEQRQTSPLFDLFGPRRF